MPQPTTTGGGLMGYPTSVDTGAIAPQALYDGDVSLNNTGAGVSNTVYFVGVILQASVVLTGVRVRFSTGGGGHYDVGIYDASGANGAPNNLLAHAAATNTTLATSSAVLTPALIGGNLALSPGKYWLALWIDNATDQIVRNTLSAGMSVCMSVSNGGPLPSAAGSPVDATFRPTLVGVLQGAFS